MSGKRLNQKICMVTRRKSCVHELPQGTEAKPGLAEPQLPTAKRRAFRSISEAETVQQQFWLCELSRTLCTEYPLTKWGKEANKEPKHTQRLVSVNARSSKLHKQHDDRAIIVVVGVTTYQGVPESGTQGKGWQGLWRG